MNILKWFERKIFLGEIIQDYGVIQNSTWGIARLRTSILLCRRRGKLKLVFKDTGISPFAASARYSKIDVTPATLSKLDEILRDVHNRIG
jgi:hypothetical protein